MKSSLFRIDNFSYTRIFFCILGILIGVAAFNFFLQNIPLDKVWALLLNANIKWIFYAAIFLIISILIKSFRWWFIISNLDRRVTFKKSNWPFVLSKFTNAILPLRFGDIIIIFYLKRLGNFKIAQLIGCLVTEKFLDVLALSFFLIVISMFLYGKNLSYEFSLIIINALIFFVFTILIILLVYMFFPKIRNIQKLEKKIFRYNAFNKIKDFIVDIFSTLKIFKSKYDFFYIIFLTILSWFFEGLLFLSVLLSLELSNFIGSWLAFVFSTFALALPGAPAGVGLFHFGAMFGMLADGANSYTAGAFALLTHSTYFFTLTFLIVISIIIKALIKLFFEINKID